MTTSLVSILIPSYNSERWIEEALESARAQTWRNWEIIVVDDGSSDNSRSILRGFADKRIKLIEQEHHGASAARNRALSEAQGAFIQFLDADDLLARDKIEIQMRRLSEEPPGYVASGAWGRFYELPIKTEFVPEPVWKDLTPVDWLVTSWQRGGMMPCHSWLTPRSVIEKAGRWDEAISTNDDGEYFTRVILNSDGVVFCPDARSYYRSGVPHSLSKRSTPEALAATYRSIEASATHLLNKENSPRTRRACAALYQQFIYDNYPAMPGLICDAESRVRSLGGTDHKLLGGGKIFRAIRSTLGWKPARRIQVVKRKLQAPH